MHPHTSLNPKPSTHLNKWGFRKIRGTLLGGPHNKDYNMFFSILGSLYFGKLPSQAGSIGNYVHELGPLPQQSAHTVVGSVILSQTSNWWEESPVLK